MESLLNTTKVESTPKPAKQEPNTSPNATSPSATPASPQEITIAAPIIDSPNRTIMHRKGRSGSVAIVGRSDASDVPSEKASVSKVAAQYEMMMGRQKGESAAKETTALPQQVTNEATVTVTRKRRNASMIAPPVGVTKSEPLTNDEPQGNRTPTDKNLVVRFDSSESDSDAEEVPAPKSVTKKSVRIALSSTETITTSSINDNIDSRSNKKRSVSMRVESTRSQHLDASLQAPAQRAQRSLTVRIETKRSDSSTTTKRANIVQQIAESPQPSTPEIVVEDVSPTENVATPASANSPSSASSPLSTLSRLPKSPQNPCIFASWCWKEGGLRKTWKRRYFKITEQSLTYGKTPYGVLSKIPLNIITTVTPYNHHSSPLRFRDFGWRMTVKKGRNAREFFIVAESRDETRVWMHILKRVMKDSWDQFLNTTRTTGIQVEDEETRKNPRNSITILPYIPFNAEAISKGIDSFRSRISLKDRFVNFTTHKQCFTGSDAVSVIQEVFRANTRFQAVCIATRFLNDFGLIEPANASLNIPVGRLELHDEKNSLYRFTDKKVEITQEFLDSISSSVNSDRFQRAADLVKTPLSPEEGNSSPIDPVATTTQPSAESGTSTTNTPVKDATPATLASASKLTTPAASTPKKLQFDVPPKIDFNLPIPTRAREQKKKIRSSVSAIAKAVMLFSESVSKLEHLYSAEAARIYTTEKREKKISGRYTVALAQRTFIEENIAEAARVENHKLQKVKREKKKNRMTSNTQDALAKAQYYANREAKLNERIYRIEKLNDQFVELNSRFATVELRYESEQKKQQESKLVQLLREEYREWDNIQYEEEEEDSTSQQNTVLTKIEVKGRKKPQSYYEEKEKQKLLKQQEREKKAALQQDQEAKGRSADSESQTQMQATKKVVDLKDAVLLTEAAAFTIDSMKDIELERLYRLQALEADMDDLTELFRDLKNIVEDSQPQLDRIQRNVANTNRNIEQGITNIRSARNNLGTSKIKEGLTRTNNVLKWTTGWG